MKTISFILLLFAVQSSTLKVGKYKAVKPFHAMYDAEQNLTINPDGTFKRDFYSASHMDIEKYPETVTGVWQQNADTLTLTDTMLFEVTAKPTIKKIFGADDTAVIRTAKYKILHESKLHFISSIAGKVKPLQYHLPDFIIQ